MSSANEKEPPNILQFFFNLKEEILVVFRNHYNRNGASKFIELKPGFCVNEILNEALNLFPKNFKFKALSFFIDEHPFVTKKLRKACQTFCINNGYYYFFADSIQTFVNGAFLNFIENEKGNEKVVLCLKNENNLEIHKYSFNETFLSFQHDFAKVFNIFGDEISSPKIKKEEEEAMVKEISNIQPNKIIFIPQTDLYEKTMKVQSQMKRLLNDIIFYNHIYFDYSKIIYSKVLNEMGYKKIPYKILPVIGIFYTITLFPINKTLIQRNRYSSLPYQETIDIKLSSEDDHIIIDIPGKKLTLNLKEYWVKHIKLTIKIDVNQIYENTIEIVGKEDNSFDDNEKSQ